MPSAPDGPNALQLNVNELHNAVARWDYEGGAGVTGPQEGYGIGSHVVQIPSAPVRQHAGIATIDRLHLDRLVRLLFAVSAIRSEQRSPGTHGTKGTRSSLSLCRETVVPGRISDALMQMIQAQATRVTPTNQP